MTAARRSVTRYWLFAVPIGLSAVYAFQGKVIDRIAEVGSQTPDLLFRVVSDSRLELFIVLPIWLLASVQTMRRKFRSQELTRFGSWKTATFSAYLSCLRGYVICSVIVSLVWTLLFLDTYDGVSSLFQGWLVSLAEGALVGTALSFCFFVVCAVTLSRLPVASGAVASVALWTWAILSNVNVFPPDSLANASLYFSLAQVIDRPGVGLALVLGLVASFCWCWLAATARDGRTSGSIQVSVTFRTGLVVVAYGLAILAAFHFGRGESVQGFVFKAFFGPGGDSIQYLFGGSVLMLITVGTVLKFSFDWHHRSSVLLLRFGSSTSWLLTLFRSEAIVLLTHLVGFVTCLVTAQAILNPSNQTWSIALLTTAWLLVKLYLSSLLYIATALLTTVLSKFDIAGVVALFAIFAIGTLIPPTAWNPATAWSERWAGQLSLIALTGLVTALVLTFTSLLTAARQGRILESAITSR